MFFVLFCFAFFGSIFFSSTAGSTGDEGDSVFPKVRLG